MTNENKPRVGAKGDEFNGNMVGVKVTRRSCIDVVD